MTRVKLPHREMRRGYRKYFPAYKKAVYRAYQGRDFKEPVKPGEFDEHLGLMGPVLKAEINDVLTVSVFHKLDFSCVDETLV